MESNRWSVRVTAGPAGVAAVYARSHRLDVGLPLSFDAEYGEITALETVLGALGADLSTGLKRTARLRRLEVDDVEALVSAELENPLVHLGVVGEAGSPSIAKIAIKVYVGSLEDEDELRELWNDVLSRSPLIRTFEKAVELELEMQIVM